jgi:hypothetical protein
MSYRSSGQIEDELLQLLYYYNWVELIKPEPEADARDFDRCEIVEGAAVVSRRDVAEPL